MDILYLLIPLSTVLALAIVGVLGWAIWRGQFDDLGQHGDMVFDADELARQQRERDAAQDGVARAPRDRDEDAHGL